MLTRFTLLFALIFMFGCMDAWAVNSKAVARTKPQRIHSIVQLRKLLKDHAIRYTFVTDRFNPQPAPMPGELATTDVANKNDAGTAVPDYSSTNVQVEGVDEGDTVKTDGEYIYQLARNEVRIIHAYPSNELKAENTITFTDGFQASEIFVEGKRLVVLGQRWDDSALATTDRLSMPVMMPTDKTETRVYDLTDKLNPKLERQISQDGSYLSSRRIDTRMYVVSRTYPRYYWLDVMPMVKSAREATESKASVADLLPGVSDSRVDNGQAQSIRLRNTFYLPDFQEPNYVVLTAFKLDEPDKPVDTQAYMGAGEVVYASPKNLYLSASSYPETKYDENGQPLESPAANTQLFKFALLDGLAQFSNSGSVPGTVLNQFSMDEHEDRFRIATTERQWNFANGEAHSHSNLFVLNDAMQITGRLENLAKDEQIHAARFMGDRCYLVTFRTIDPLFVIGFEGDKNPTVLGELKIPGYSDYLHLYDENHVIGFGMETTDQIATDWGTIVRNKGMRIALFDVSDVANPIEKTFVSIGDIGTYSELLYNHKALWFDRENNLLGFPIQVAKIKDESSGDTWAYGEPVFQGAYVYRLTLEDGFSKPLALTHMKTDVSIWEQWPYAISRLLNIGTSLYTLSDGKLMVNTLPQYSTETGLLESSELGTLDFPVELPEPCCVVPEPLPVETVVIPQ